MRHWKRIVAVLLVAAVALILEGWAASAQAAPFFKNCTYTRVQGETGRPPYSLAPAAGQVTLTVRTNRGDLVLTLDRGGAPCAVHSLTHLALKRFYNQTPCPHRTRAILECGVGRPGYRFAPELSGHETYRRGTVALSNTNGNGSAFFIVHTETALPKTSTIVGTVTGGLPVLDRIAASPQQPVRVLEVLVG